MPSNALTAALQAAHGSISTHIPFSDHIRSDLDVLFPYNSRMTDDDLLAAASLLHDQISLDTPATTDSLNTLAGRIFQDRLLNHYRIERESREQIAANAALMDEIENDIRLHGNRSAA